jgi:hypothetical protein
MIHIHSKRRRCFAFTTTEPRANRAREVRHPFSDGFCVLRVRMMDLITYFEADCLDIGANVYRGTRTRVVYPFMESDSAGGGSSDGGALTTACTSSTREALRMGPMSVGLRRQYSLRHLYHPVAKTIHVLDRSGTIANLAIRNVVMTTEMIGYLKRDRLDVIEQRAASEKDEARRAEKARICLRPRVMFPLQTTNAVKSRVRNFDE